MSVPRIARKFLGIPGGANSFIITRMEKENENMTIVEHYNCQKEEEPLIVKTEKEGKVEILRNLFADCEKTEEALGILEKYGIIWE